jgi:hypothetical protein
MKAAEIEPGDERMFDCENCEAGQRFDALDPANWRAWELYPRVCSRFTLDTHTAALVLDCETAGDEPADVSVLIQRLALLYRICNPVKQSSDGA